MKRLLHAFFLLAGVTVRADAHDYTDIWYNAAQPGYRFNFVQSDTFIFATFFVYSFAGQPRLPAVHRAPVSRGPPRARRAFGLE